MKSTVFVKPKYLSVHRKITIYWKTTLSLAIVALMVLDYLQVITRKIANKCYTTRETTN